MSMKYWTMKEDGEWKEGESKGKAQIFRSDLDDQPVFFGLVFARWGEFVQLDNGKKSSFEEAKEEVERFFRT